MGMCIDNDEPVKDFVPTSTGIISPGILTGMNRPWAHACLTKWTRHAMCLVYLEFFSLFIIAILLLESMKVRGRSGSSFIKPLKTCFRWMVAVTANAVALYSDSALDSAMGTGTKDAPSTKLPCIYTTKAPVLHDVSTQTC